MSDELIHESPEQESVASGEAPDGGVDVHGDPDAPVDALEGFEGAEILEGIPWRVAEALKTLRAQIKAAAPNRSIKSDGSIGDDNHMKKGFNASDHNPHVRDGGMGVVTAVDITHDPQGGCDAGRLAASLEASRDARIKYIIWNRKIANSSPVGAAAAWTWRDYKGSNPHNKHVHISVRPEKGRYDSTAPWTFKLG